MHWPLFAPEFHVPDTVKKIRLDLNVEMPEQEVGSVYPSEDLG